MPKSNYFFFSSEIMKTRRDDEHITDVAKRVGNLWKKMSAEEKAPYDAMHEKDKQRYVDLFF